MGISGVGPQAAAKPNVLGNVHCIVSCNSIVKDPCGLSVGGSRSAPIIGAGLYGPREASAVSSPGEASRTLFLITYKKTSWRAESRVKCRLA